MDPNNHFNTQNSSNTPDNYQNPNYYQNLNYYQNPNQFSNQHPPNFHPYYGSMTGNSSQAPPFHGYMPMVNENFPSGGAPEFPGFSTQMTMVE